MGGSERNAGQTVVRNSQATGPPVSISMLSRMTPISTDDAVTRPLITQLVRAGTSIGANNCEADNAVSRRDFRNKIGICRKESAETKYWLRVIVAAEPRLKDAARPLWQEANELNLIYARSFHTAGE